MNRVFMLTSYEPDKLLVRRSGFSTFPLPLTKVITAQRLSGSCCCYRRSVFKEFQFDENLKKWANMEDIDFSYRLYKKYPTSLYAVPYARVIHKGSPEGRLPEKTRIYMSTTYWFYVFFKDIFRGSLLNLTAFLWTLIGNPFVNAAGLIIKRKPRREWWGLIYLLDSIATAFRNLKDIRMLRLGFLDKNLWGKKMIRCTQEWVGADKVS
jgi:GT2 family glycosyltransferase